MWLTNYFRSRMALAEKMSGSAKIFAVFETICFPISILTVVTVVVHSIIVFSTSLAQRFGIDVGIPPLPDWTMIIAVSAAVGYLTNYIAIQMLYYPIDASDLNSGATTSSDDTSDMRVSAIRKSRVISLTTLGFWTRGLIPRNREKVAWQIGKIAEERFVTPEAAAKILPKITKALLSRNEVGKIRGIEMLRGLVNENRESVAEVVRSLGMSFIRNGDKTFIREFVAKIGRSEAAVTALTGALLKYIQDNPLGVETFMRDLVSACTQNLARPRKDERETLLGGLSQLVRGVTGAVIEGVAEVGIPQIRSYVESCATNAERRRGVQEKLSTILPIICDKIGQSIVENPALLENVISGETIQHLVNVKLDDEEFWGSIGENLAPHLEVALNKAFDGMSSQAFAKFFGKEHLVAENIRDTILRMPLLDFYSMLDDVMAEHLGAIQVFGFVLGGAIGYVQYAVLFAQKGCVGTAYLMIGVPLVLVVLAKIVISIRHVNAKAINA